MINNYPPVHAKEEYYCNNCKKYYDYFSVYKDWTCPNCGELIQIRIKTDKLDNTCFRIPLSKLKVSDMVLIDRNDDFREVLNIKEEKNSFRIAIKGYSVLNIEKNSFIIILQGGWYNK